MREILGHPIIVAFFLVVFSPLGIILMFAFSEWSKGVKITLAVVSMVIFIAAMMMTMNEIAAEEAGKAMSYIKTLKPM